MGIPVTNLVLRACRYEDLDKVLAIERASYPDSPYARTDFDIFLLVAKKGFLVACQGDSLLGYVIATEKGGSGLIQSVAVSPESRRKHVGRALMTAALDYLAKSERAVLQVDPSNESAISLYHKLSFRETGSRIRGYYPNGNDAIEMVRELDSSQDENVRM